MPLGGGGGGTAPVQDVRGELLVMIEVGRALTLRETEGRSVYPDLVELVGGLD